MRSGAGSQFGIMTFPDQSRGVREMTRVVKRGGRVLMIVYGSPAEIDFLGFFVSAVHSVRSDFVPPMLNVTTDERGTIESTMHKLWEERAASTGVPRLTAPINIGWGTK